MSFEIGTLLAGRYRLLRRLASGGMGTIFEATQEGLGRKVAIKVVRPELVSKAGLTRLAREARAAATLTHPHIATVYDFVDSPGETPFLVLELLEGETLRAFLQREGAMEASRAVRLTTQILSALGAAHASGIIHRDIKPSNVFVTSSPTLGEVAKILDFGVAKVLESDAALTTEGAAIGTIAYMSPEQFAAEDVDARSDIFATGLVLYEALSGTRAYAPSHAPTLMRLVEAGDVTPLNEVAPDVDPGLCAIVLRALAPDPALRYGSAQEMSAALAAWTRGESGTDTLSVKAARAPSRSIAPSLAISRPQKQGLAGLAAVAFLAGTGLVYFGAGGATTTGPHGPNTDPRPTTTQSSAPPSDVSVDASASSDVDASAPDQRTPTSASTPSAPLQASPSRPTGALSKPPPPASSASKVPSKAPRVGAPCDHKTGSPTGSGLVCNFSTSKWFCPKDTTACEGETTCRRLDLDRNNCGACGERCLPDEICVTGKRIICRADSYRCDNMCFMAGTFENCGGCSNRCGVGEECIARKCEKRP